ncbi:MAG: hypothetical protein ACLQVM_03580 [Terriglobia bacterium]
MIAAELVILAFAIFTMNNAQSPRTAQAPVALAHVRNSFHFLVHTPLSSAATLFGPDGERSWAGEDWNPQFLYPQPGKDIQGAVFTIQKGHHKSVWITTLFDVANGRIQYVSFEPDVKVSTVDVRLTSVEPSTTSVEVTYVRTALDASANDEVQALGQRDHRQEGIHWQEAIETCLKKGPCQ